ncbi:hypothetical protein K450DRAFT_247259 [Umbelopsis ramanniana AG]|uniref:Myb-like domain-containing protein n=1 Tax=Umbelopsis ramanniana AG TaxID=1314678 RepID=A0AAD5E7J7_UMBRA|nr:uncharacterized protein K450DRAFT_247259 [Umbelopsis ramanniana AG]KAI8578319.1 hypothetical protein K450DRAFT_247259 [Umbelopsis ramanniana AG]
MLAEESIVEHPVEVKVEEPTNEEVDPILHERQEWIKHMRLKFCIRPEFEITKTMIHEDGTLNQDYFRPPKGAKPEEARKWTDNDKTLLIQGIEKYGIGHFTEISRELLPKWSGNDLRLKTIRLIGRQNLQLYKGWKGNADDISRQFEKNKEVGLKYGTWKQGCLVYDDDGLVEQELLAMKRSDTATSADNEDSEVAVDDDVEMEDAIR